MNQQSEAWAGSFGDQYANRSPGNVEANVEFFKRALPTREWSGRGEIKTVIEFGAGVGSNLLALKQILPHADMAAVEINEQAVRNLEGFCRTVSHGSMLDCTTTEAYDLAFTKGVLIHIPPAELDRAYEVLYKASSRYILIAEYFAPKITEIEYRGRMGLLWKGPHAYDMLDTYHDLKLVDYGFVSSRDQFPQDDLNFWLMEKP